MEVSVKYIFRLPLRKGLNSAYVQKGFLVMCHQGSQPTTCFTYTRHTITSRSQFELCNDSPNTSWLVIFLPIFELYGHIPRAGSSEQIKQQSDYIPYTIKIISYDVVLNMNKLFFLDISKWRYDPFLAIPRKICFANVNV